MAKSLYLIDGHYQIYRAFYGLSQPLTSPTGEPTAATHVFFSMLFSLIRNRRPDYLAMVMDVSDETVFRKDIDANYKAHRDPPPEALSLQADRIVSIVEALGMPIFRVPGYEADDLMATIAAKLKSDDVDVYLVSKDKDLEQLISDRVRLYDSAKDVVIDENALLMTKGYRPQQAVEVQTLVGDSTDNIPGVQGVGIKTAVKLIGEYGSARAVLDNAGKLTPKLAERVRAFAPQIDFTRQLVTLTPEVPCDFELSQCAVGRFNPPAAKPSFRELGMNRLAEQLDVLSMELGLAGSPEEFSLHPVADGGGRDAGLALAGISRTSAGRSVAPVPHAETPKSADTARSDEAFMGVSAPAGDYVLVDTAEAFERFISQLYRQTAFAFDTETTSIRPVDAKLVGLSFSWRAGEAFYLPVRATMGRVLPIDLVIEKLKPIFENPHVGKIGHHIKYDVLVLRQHGIETAGIAFDTLIASFVLDPVRRSYGLDALAQGLLGLDMIPITDLIGKGRNQITMDEVDPVRVCEYACCDADFTLRLHDIFAQQLAGGPYEPLFRETEMPLVEVLAEMEHNGIALDTHLLREIGLKLGDRLVELTREVHAAAGRAFNLDSPQQLSTILFDDLGFSVVRKTKTGRSTDADTLEALAAQSEHPVPKLVLEYRELSKLKNTYVDTLPSMVSRRTGRVHASFHQTGAVTGRLSSSDPNLQNIPIRTETGKQIRQAFVAGSPDHVLLAADYSQIELRILAHFSQDRALLDAFESGQDIHRTVAAQVNGVPLEEVTSAQRSAAKAVNFGIIYGQTPFGLAKTLAVPVGEAKAFIDTYFLRYPGIRMFIDDCVAEARKKGFAQTILGRRRPIPELHSRNRGQVSFGERIAVNTVIQGSAADLIKRAMIDIHRAIKSGELSARMLLQVHDELVFEVLEKVVERESGLIREKMEQPIDLHVPLVADISWGRTWADAK